MELRRTTKIITSLILLFIFIYTANSLVFNLKNVDRDGDNLSDKKEILIGTDPLNIDTDKDGMNDLDEYNYWINRSKEDLSSDFSNFWKEYYKQNFNLIITDGKIRSLLLPTGDIDNDNLSNICDIDSDNDRINDYKEILNKTDPALPTLNSPSGTHSNTSEDNGGGNTSYIEVNKYITKTYISLISSEDIYKKGVFYVKGSVISENMTGVKNSTIEIFINKTKDTNGSISGEGEPDSSGKFNISCTVPDDVKVGSNHIVAHYLGNKEYRESWSDPLVDVYSETQIEFDMLDSVGKNSTFQIKGILSDIGGLQLNHKNIVLNMENIEIGSTTTNKNGIFVLNHSIGNLGKYEITAIFKGEEFLNSSKNTITLKVKDMGTYLDTSISQNILKREDEITIQGYLFDSKDHCLSNSKIEILYDSGKTIDLITNSNGFFKETIKIPKNCSLGKNKIKILYLGNNLYGGAEKEHTITVKSDTILKINQPTDTNFNRNETFTVSGVLTDSYNKPLENRIINVYPKLTTSIKRTDKNGTFNFNIKIPKNTSDGKYKILIYFNSTQEKYNPTQKNLFIKVGKNELKGNNNILIIIGALILFGIGGVILSLLKKQKSKTNNNSIKKITTESIDNLQNEKDLRKAVLKCYSDICKWLDASGLKKESGETPREFAVEIKDRLNVTDECLISLTKIFEKACYSKHEINLQERDKTIECLDEILSSLVNESNSLNKEK